MKLKDYALRINELIEQGHGDLEVIYSKDDEGNSYHKVIYDAGPVKVVDLNSYYLDLLDNEDPTSEGVAFNAITIN